tara:strand:+ start:1767 stop:2201 length:435 start_codon:yes stop_codon:yes gene_type:complete
MTDVSRRLEAALGTARVTNKASLIRDFEEKVMTTPVQSFTAKPPTRFVVPKSFVGVEAHFTLIRDDEYAFAYAIVLYYGGKHIEHYILTYWRQNTPFSREDNEEYLLPRDSRWCDTFSRSRREGANNDVRLLMRELGHNTAERF